jgi:ZIP family zinc transporter
VDDSREDAALAIALGTFIDGIPEAIVIGLSLIDGTGVALATVIAIFLSNIPEALSSSAGMKAAGRSAAYVFGLWGAIMLVSGVASLTGYLAFADVPPEVVAVTQSVAAGALLALIADTMIPEAFAETQDAAGLIAALGFLSGFALSHGLA